MARVLYSIPFNQFIRRGDSIEVPFRDWNIDGTPIDITTWKIFHTAKCRPDGDDTDAAAVISRDNVNDPAVIVKYDNNSNGFPDSFLVIYQKEDTKDLVPGLDYVQDIQIVDGTGAPRTYAYGDLVVGPDVTGRTTT